MRGLGTRVFGGELDRDIVQALVKAVELKDRSTAAHTWRVALYMQALIEAAGIDQEEAEPYIRGAVLHDVGKIDVPQSILAKPGPLTEEEFDIIRRHTVLGYERLVRMGERDEIVLGLVRSHHERIDGSGYPDRLAGDDIPRVAQFFAVIDTFDALTSIRPYREAVGEGAAASALLELKRYTGIHHSTEAVERFVSLYESGAISWVLHHFNDAAAHDLLNSIPDYRAIEEVRARGSPPEVVIDAEVNRRLESMKSRGPRA